MEKNVPLLKLIHDPWSIKTMLLSLFFCFSFFNACPSFAILRSPRPLYRNTSHLLQEKPKGGRGHGGGASDGIGRTKMREEKEQEQYTFLSVVGTRGYCNILLQLQFLSSRWCEGAAAPSPQKPHSFTDTRSLTHSLTPTQHNWKGRSQKSTTGSRMEAEEGQGDGE